MGVVVLTLSSLAELIFGIGIGDKDGFTLSSVTAMEGSSGVGAGIGQGDGWEVAQQIN